MAVDQFVGIAVRHLLQLFRRVERRFDDVHVRPRFGRRGTTPAIVPAPIFPRKPSLPMQPITIRYSFRPVRRSLATNRVADLFGLADDEPPHTVADQVSLDIRPRDLVLFTGPSGSGK